MSFLVVASVVLSVLALDADDVTSETLKLQGAPSSCSLETTMAGGIGGANGGAVYFDLNVVAPITVLSIGHKYRAAPAGCTVEFYTRPNTSVGFEKSPDGWNLTSTGFSATVATPPNLIQATFDYPDFTLAAGNYGVALKYINCGSLTSNGLTSATNADLTVTPRTAKNVAFANGALLSQRVNIRFDYRRVSVCPTDDSVSTDAGQCGANYNYSLSGTATQTAGLASGSTFPVGATLNTFSFGACPSSCSFTVTVNDTQPPTIACPSDIVVKIGSSQSGAIVTYMTPVGSDNCAGATTAQTAGLASGSTFAVGTTTNTFTVSAAGNQSASCTFVVTVAQLPCFNSVDESRCDDGRAETHTDVCIDNTCTSCADRKQCADVKDISLTLPDGRLICGDVVDPDSHCPSPKLKISAWNRTSLTNDNSQSATLSEFTGCFTPTFANNTLVGFTNVANGRSIKFSRNGQCWLKFVKPVVGSDNKRNALQATTTAVTISAAHLLPAVSGATGDPHISGPRGEHFEFQGQASRRYTMISSPKFLVNVQMSGERGGDVRFMTQVQIVVGKVEYFVSSIDLHQATQETFNGLNSLLAPHAANVTLFNRRHDGVVPLPPQLVLDLCGGQERVIITAIKPSARQVAAFKLFETTQYFNIEFEVDGCHDNFDGVIGQLYQCKYNAQPFVYDAAVVEQRFAVENFANNLPQFDPFFKCLQLQANDDIVGNAAAFQ